MTRNGAYSSWLLGGGVLLVLVSAILPQAMTGRGRWSDELAGKLQHASQHYHAAIHAGVHKHSPADTDGQNLEAARREYGQRRALLEAAQTSGERAAGILRWCGIFACGVGLVAYVFSMMTTKEK